LLFRNYRKEGRNIKISCFPFLIPYCCSGTTGRKEGRNIKISCFPFLMPYCCSGTTGRKEYKIKLFSISDALLLFRNYRKEGI
jgi:hypothetical protein